MLARKAVCFFFSKVVFQVWFFRATEHPLNQVNSVALTIVIHAEIYTSHFSTHVCRYKQNDENGTHGIPNYFRQSRGCVTWETVAYAALRIAELSASVRISHLITFGSIMWCLVRRSDKTHAPVFLSKIDEDNKACCCCLQKQATKF